MCDTTTSAIPTTRTLSKHPCQRQQPFLPPLNSLALFPLSFPSPFSPHNRCIRSKALVQFTEPFTSLNLAHAAAALNTDVPGVQGELETLISRGEINALIDSHNGVLYARRRDQRGATFQDAIAAGVFLCSDGGVCVRVDVLPQITTMRTITTNHHVYHHHQPPHTQRKHIYGMPRHSCCVQVC